MNLKRMTMTMTMKKSKERDTYNAYSIRIRSPSGTMFLVVNEVDEKIDNVQLYIGKTGSILYAYVNSVADLINLALSSGASIEDVITVLSNQTSDKISYHENVVIRSDVDAIVYGLLRYKHMKYKANNEYARPILRQVR